MDNSILCKIEATIKKYELLDKGDRVLVALSGGADSVFLLNVMLLLRDKFNLTFFAAHINHGLRGKDSDSDEEFCKKLCNGKNIELFIKRADVANVAAQKSVSEEVAGRIVRYDFFEELCQKHSINKIATAHNQDDNIETVLMRFLRGSGVLGLCGIPYKNGNIIRPILDIPRCDIECFFKENELSYVTDKTNFEQFYTRNKLRLSLIPQIEENINKGFKKSLVSNISLYNECSDFLSLCENEAYSKSVTKRKFHIEADIDKLSDNHKYIIKSVIKRIVGDFSCEATYENVCDCIDVLNGLKKKCSLHGQLTVMSAYGKLYFYKDIPEKFCYIYAGNRVLIKETGALVCFSKTDSVEKNAGRNVFFADRDKLKNITIRSRKDGDVFYPSGKNKEKVKLKDYFINNKVPSFLRDTVPVVLSGEDIIWVAGFRHTKDYAATKDTKNIMKIEIIDGGF